GYDNKKNISADTSIELEGGEIGSGNSITAVFELLPNYDDITTNPSKKDIATIILNYRKRDEILKENFTYTCPQNFKELKDIPGELRFATAVTMFGLILRQSKYLGEAKLSDVGLIAGRAINPQDYLQNEFLSLVEKAKKIYTKKKKRKSRRK
ncbi:MAG: YfbK domain-containing protein, partial [Ginsengibacter sp.]